LIQNVAAIADKDRSAFKDAAGTVLDNFTHEEQQRIAAMASELRAILTAAKKRNQERLAKAR